MFNHKQGDHLFNDWRAPFDGLEASVLKVTGKPPVASRIAATFEPFRLAPRVDEARQFTVKCLGHASSDDYNSQQYGSLKTKFETTLRSYVLHRTAGQITGVENEHMKRILALDFSFLTRASIDQSATKRFLHENPAKRSLIAAIELYYVDEAPRALIKLLNEPWEPAPF